MALRKAGGNTIIHCGDVFHVRGNVAPAVLNQVLDLYKGLIDRGFQVYMISGNHDLETEDAKRAASAVTALEGIGVKVIHEPTVEIIEGARWHFIPWYKSLDKLRGMFIKTTAKSDMPLNLVIHAPLNGVIASIPDHGLSPKDFEKTPYSKVFVGHYHNHKAFGVRPHSGGAGHPIYGCMVYSVGALTHQSWSDVDNKAGYVLYDALNNEVAHHETRAPKFIKVHISELDALDFEVEDNYIKVYGGTFSSPEDIQAIKDDLVLHGAKAVSVEGLVKKIAATRAGTTPATAPTLESILDDYIARTWPGDAEVQRQAQAILKATEND